jgi:hypothetical protein
MIVRTHSSQMKMTIKLRRQRLELFRISFDRSTKLLQTNKKHWTPKSSFKQNFVIKLELKTLKSFLN